MKIVVGTGWHSDGEKKGLAKELYWSNWLKDTWKSAIEKYIIPDRYFVYLSPCKIMPQLDNDFNWVKALENPVIGGLHGYNYHGAMLMAAMFAHVNDASLIWIEQDCLVYGLDKAIGFAKDKWMVYGYGKDASFYPEWAAQSFVWVHRDFTQVFIEKLMDSNIQRVKDIPETIFHDIFKKLYNVHHWQYGFDRKQITDIDLPYFYKQQLKEGELKLMKEKIGIN